MTCLRISAIHYITNTTDEMAEKTESQRIKRIHEQVKRIKLSEKMGVKYMQLWEEKAYIQEEGYEEGHTQGLGQGLEQGLEQGHIQGLAEGGEKQLINQICKKLGKGKRLEQIADEVEESLELVEKICLAAQKEAPDYDCNRIYARLHEGE